MFLFDPNYSTLQPVETKLRTGELTVEEFLDDQSSINALTLGSKIVIEL